MLRKPTEATNQQPTPVSAVGNIDPATVTGFGEEWRAYDQQALAGAEYDDLFERYFGLFPFEKLPARAEGFDLGCGSGRWAQRVLERVGTLHCIDPSEEALAVAKRRLRGDSKARFHLASADTIPLEDESQDFGYSLGVLHHIPNTARALNDCVRKLKRGAPFLVYLYYQLDNRPGWYRLIWKSTDPMRRSISRLPFAVRNGLSTMIAGAVYWPIARTARLLESLGADVTNIPLSAYRSRSFYSMRTDALDRFGTRLEQRFSQGEIRAMMIEAGLRDVRFSDREPFWVACGTRV